MPMKAVSHLCLSAIRTETRVGFFRLLKACKAGDCVSGMTKALRWGATGTRQFQKSYHAVLMWCVSLPPVFWDRRTAWMRSILPRNIKRAPWSFIWRIWCCPRKCSSATVGSMPSACPSMAVSPADGSGSQQGLYQRLCEVGATV